jgi:hypothetical protein
VTAFTSQGLDHDVDPVLFVHLKFRLVEPGINPRLLSDPASLWAGQSRKQEHPQHPPPTRDVRLRGGVDSAFSLEPAEAERKSLVFRRAIYAAANIAAGETFTESKIRIVRPGDSAPPSLSLHQREKH